MLEEELIKWFLSILSAFVASLLGTIAWVRAKVMDHGSRISVLEKKKTLSEAEVRHIVKEEVEAIKDTLKEIQHATRHTQHTLTELRVATGVLLRLAHRAESKFDLEIDDGAD